MSAFRPCILIPTYDNPRTVRDVVLRAREHLADVVVVDDGSHEEGRAAVAGIGRDGLAHVTHRAQNGGKGAAVKTGFAFARELGFTHALQVDADGQHALEDIPDLLNVARAQPGALILGRPEYDESAPIGRRIARNITIFWTHMEAGWGVIADPMCGFRVYPLESALRACAECGDRMDFDPEIAVRIAWTGAPVVNLPTKVRYVEGGVSHFKLFLDNWLISRMHTRLMWHRAWCTVLGRPLVPALPAPSDPIVLEKGASEPRPAELPGDR
ncbi:glycosyltransferase family 2 protein [Sandaracinus amylolyticus]|uniref:Glycosyl transferase n=1 Tax=Sandaracinus amylolyticus TaxID=927083 RepID=A0A0F6SI01_9BACT|nr:glycosyltransferase family 2 protein [Sandaracinus amylolyticus]AKF11334.1 Glycosyl transferase [Sandaracinus amylolyticus]